MTRENKPLYLFSVLSFLFASIESFLGFRTDSLALNADASHMFLTASSLMLTAFTTRLTQQTPLEPSMIRTYKEMLVAFATCLIIFSCALNLWLHGTSRLLRMNILPDSSNTIIITSFIAAGINGATLRLIDQYKYLYYREGIRVLLISDLACSCAALIAGAGTLYWPQADSIFAILIAFPVIRYSVYLMRLTFRIAIVDMPRQRQLAEISTFIEAHHLVDKVTRIQIVPEEGEKLILSANIVPKHKIHWETLKQELENSIATHFAIRHCTFSEAPHPTSEIMC